jgi:hypothetical protein
MTDIDFDARYTVERFGPGIAFWLAGYVEEEREVEHEIDGEFEYVWETVTNDNMVQAIMVGDDIVHFVDVDELTVIGDDDYCHQCGQVGCTHDGRER